MRNRSDSKYTKWLNLLKIYSRRKILLSCLFLREQILFFRSVQSFRDAMLKFSLTGNKITIFLGFYYSRLSPDRGYPVVVSGIAQSCKCILPTTDLWIDKRRNGAADRPRTVRPSDRTHGDKSINERRVTATVRGFNGRASLDIHFPV